MAPPTDAPSDLSRYVLPRFLESDGPVEFAARLEGISVEDIERS